MLFFLLHLVGFSGDEATLHIVYNIVILVLVIIILILIIVQRRLCNGAGKLTFAQESHILIFWVYLEQM